MKIAGEDATYFRELFSQAMKEGDRYVCLDPGNNDRPFSGDTIRFFKDRSDALYYSYCKRTEEHLYLETLPILSVQEQLCRKMELQQLDKSSRQATKDLIIDINHIHYLEKARKEIFAEEILRNLRSQNVKVDHSRLQNYISADFQKFMIDGMRWERGVERPCLVQIEQNESRAFLISQVKTDLAIDQQKVRLILNNRVLAGKLSEIEASSLKNVFKTERDNGNFYAVFPSGKEALNKGDFSFFKSVYDAWEHIGKQALNEEKLVFRSISLLKDDLEQQLNTHKEKEEVPERNRSRGRDLSQER